MTTNYSGVAYSDDNGQTWRLAPTSIRTAAWGRATVPYVSGNEKFQQTAFVKPPAHSPDATQGWVYAYGTPSGRGGTVYLSRVQGTHGGYDEVRVLGRVEMGRQQAVGRQAGTARHDHQLLRILQSDDVPQRE